MARLFFHCANERGTYIDQTGVDMTDLSDACEHADRLVRSLVGSPCLEDWRDWTLHVCDDVGDDLFVVPFASALSAPN